MMNAMKVMRAAVNETRDAKRVTVMCCDNPSNNAMNVTPAATSRDRDQTRARSGNAWGRDIPTGWMARPRVHDEPMVTELPCVLLMATE